MIFVIFGYALSIATVGVYLVIQYTRGYRLRWVVVHTEVREEGVRTITVETRKLKFRR